MIHLFVFCIKYSGKWYEIERFPNLYEYGLDCVTAEYGYINPTKVSVKNEGTNLYVISTRKRLTN